MPVYWYTARSIIDRAVAPSSFSGLARKFFGSLAGSSSAKYDSQNTLPVIRFSMVMLMRRATASVQSNFGAIAVVSIQRRSNAAIGAFVHHCFNVSRKLRTVGLIEKVKVKCFSARILFGFSWDLPGIYIYIQKYSQTIPLNNSKNATVFAIAIALVTCACIQLS